MQRGLQVTPVERYALKVRVSRTAGKFGIDDGQIARIAIPLEAERGLALLAFVEDVLGIPSFNAAMTAWISATQSRMQTSFGPK